MQKIDARAKSFQELWKGDKELVRLSHPGIEVDWDAELPTQDDAHKILAARNHQWKNPAEPFQLTYPSLAGVTDFLAAEIENAWGDKLQRPDVEILPRNRYLPKIHELEGKTNRQFGYGDLQRYPPTMYTFPSHGILLMPEKYLAIVPKGSSDFSVMELPWDRAFLEEVLCEELSHALFRQLRGEWRGDYVRSMKSVGPESEARISSINETMAQYAKEIIARNVKKQWGLYVASEKLAHAWQNRLGMNDYLGIDALAASRRLAQIAMVDGIEVPSRSGVYISFDPRHPYNGVKEQTFIGRK